MNDDATNDATDLPIKCNHEDTADATVFNASTSAASAASAIDPGTHLL